MDPRLPAPKYWTITRRKRRCLVSSHGEKCPIEINLDFHRDDQEGITVGEEMAIEEAQADRCIINCFTCLGKDHCDNYLTVERI